MYRPQDMGWDGVGDWQNVTMTQRTLPKGDEQGEYLYCKLSYCMVGVKFEFYPSLLADEYYYHGTPATILFTHCIVTGFENVLLDYYVSAVDKYGNIKNSDIYH